MATFNTLAYYFQTYGVMDFLLPFVLVFTVAFAILQKSKILGDDVKNFNVVVSLALSLLFVVPHITGTYPGGYDPVQILNQTLPGISLVAIASLMVLLLLGVFGKGFSDKANPVIAIIAIGFVVYIFGASLNFWHQPSNIFGWWSSETTELLIVILVFGLIVTFVTKDDSKGKGDGGKAIKSAGQWLSGLVKDQN